MIEISKLKIKNLLKTSEKLIALLLIQKADL